LQYAKEELEYAGGRTTLWGILKSMGYKYKIVNDRKILCERKYVIAAKIKFLRQYKQLKENGRKFVYLDETWIYQKSGEIILSVGCMKRTLKVILLSENERKTIHHFTCWV
jgi:hypothetical protein